MSRDVKIIVYSFMIYLATGFSFLLTDKDFLVFLPVLPILILFATLYFFVVSIQKEFIPSLLIFTNSLGIVGILFLDIYNPTYTFLVIISLLSFSLSGIFLASIVKRFLSFILGILFSLAWLYVFDNLYLDFMAWAGILISSFIFYKKYKTKLRSSQIRLILQIGLISGLLLLTLFSDYIIQIT